MKKAILLTAAMLLCVSVALAGEDSCPADRAGKEGFNPVAAFHHVVAPAWHGAWPEKNYEALYEAGPEFVEAFKGIAEMKPTFKTETRAQRFEGYRAKLSELVTAFNEACTAKDQDKVYELMPALHDSFEMVASSLLPIHYPEFDGFVVSVNLLTENHIPADNTEGILGTTETLVAKAEGLNAGTIPEDLKGVEKEVVVELDAIKSLVSQLKECCDKQDMEGVKKHAAELDEKVDSFVEKYI